MDSGNDADEAELELRSGLERSRKVIADYRVRLMRLARRNEAERRLFRWRKD